MYNTLRLLRGHLLHIRTLYSPVSLSSACKPVPSVGDTAVSTTTPAQFLPLLIRSFSTPKEKERTAKAPIDDASEIPLDRIRNFSIIAHIDHGKSTLSDRLIESCTNRTVKQSQLLDTLDVERERGITVKANSASFVYKHNGENYLMNLVDTPGHVDFSYEVSRSLSACQGACLLVDAAQGIQAQTLANFYLAFELDLTIVPVLNKIDLPAADPARTAADVQAAFDMPEESCIHASAKTGLGIENVLKAVVERVPPPQGDPNAPFKLLLFDAKSDEFRGVICMVLVKDGCVRKGDRFKAVSTGLQYDVLELGVMAPEMRQADCLKTGQVGYVITGLKSTNAVRVGDTWHHAKATNVTPLPGFRVAKAMMFAGIYPLSQEGFDRLADAMDKLTLNDASVTVRKESSVALGPGFRCGFLGMLHMDVFMQRLMDEHGSEVLTTTPMVPYRLKLQNGSVVDLESPLDFPKDARQSVESIEEPTVDCTILVPDAHTGTVMTLCSTRRGDLLEHSYLSADRCVIRYRLPLAELASSFYSTLKAQTSGYASFDYEPGPHRTADLARMDFLVHGSPVDALSRVLHRDDALSTARNVCKKLVEAVSRQSFEVAIQAVVDNKVLTRETIRATRKDVLAKCYGGDVSRKRKLLDKQREGKSRMRKLGAVSLEPEAFHRVMSAR